MSLFRIGANLDAMNSMRSLSEINQGLAVRQARLASGKRINTAQDDTAGYSISKTLESRGGGLESALMNVQNAKSILAIAESGYQGQMEILQAIKSKAVQASDEALNTTQRAAIDMQVYELLEEFDDIGNQTKWADTSLINTSGNRTFSFHVGGDTAEELLVTLTASNSASTIYDETVGGTAYTLTGLATAAGAGSIGTGVTTADDAIEVVDAAIDALAALIQGVGDKMVRLGKKEDFLSVSVANTEAVRSSYEDADFAEEQMESLKLQILQQTAVSSLAQANSSPQVVLGLFR